MGLWSKFERRNCLGGYCTISTVCSVVCHNRPWTEPKVPLMTTHEHVPKKGTYLQKFCPGPILHVNVVPNQSPAPYADALPNFSPYRALNRYWSTRNKPQKFRSQATLACEPMNWRSPFVTCHIRWTYGRNGTVYVVISPAVPQPKTPTVGFKSATRWRWQITQLDMTMHLYRLTYTRDKNPF